MGIFDRKPQVNKTPPKKIPKDTKEPPKEPVFSEAEAECVSEFDFTKIQDPELALFVRYYILSGGNGKAAYLRLRNNKVTPRSAEVGANRFLRKLRQHPDFLDIMGLGYENLKEIVDLLKMSKPEKAADIVMKFNKEDTDHIEHSGQVKILFEKELDE
jgi:hypothetical protein